MHSPNNLNISSASLYRYIKIKLKNNTSEINAQLFFINSTDTNWNEAKSTILSGTLRSTPK